MQNLERMTGWDLGDIQARVGYSPVMYGMTSAFLTRMERPSSCSLLVQLLRHRGKKHFNHLALLTYR